MRRRLFEIGSQRKGPWEHLVGKRRLKLGNKSPSKGRATRLAQPGIGTLRKCEVHNNGKPGQLVIFCVEFVRVQKKFFMIWTLCRHKKLFTSTVRLTIWKKKQRLKQKKKSNKQKMSTNHDQQGKICVCRLVRIACQYFSECKKNSKFCHTRICFFTTNTSSAALPYLIAQLGNLCHC